MGYSVQKNLINICEKFQFLYEIHFNFGALFGFYAFAHVFSAALPTTRPPFHANARACIRLRSHEKSALLVSTIAHLLLFFVSSFYCVINAMARKQRAVCSCFHWNPKCKSLAGFAWPNVERGSHEEAGNGNHWALSSQLKQTSYSIHILGFRMNNKIWSNYYYNNRMFSE